MRVAVLVLLSILSGGVARAGDPLIINYRPSPIEVMPVPTIPMIGKDGREIGFFGGPSGWALDGTAHPNVVDLGVQLDPKTARQQRGGSCHTYAAVDVVEAGCYREAGVRLDLSEAYIFYENLRLRLDEPETDTLLQEDSHALEPTESGLLVGELDGGYAEKDIAQILAGHSLPESELSIDELANWLNTTKNSRCSPDDLACGLDDFVESEVSLKLVPSILGSGLQPVSVSPDLYGCVHGQKLKQYAGKFNLNRALELLELGVVFACSYTRPGSPVDDPSHHAISIIGYRRNPNFPNGLQFKVSDSNYPSPIWTPEKIETCDLGINYVGPAVP